jgi:hypothetical protein
MNRPLIAYFGHHKCATTWINTIAALVCERLNLKFVNVSGPDMFAHRLDEFVARNGVDFLSYINANAKDIGALHGMRGFHVVRDPRDIIVSAYFSHRYSHPTEGWDALVEHRQRLQRVSKDEGLLLEMEFSRQVLDELYAWNYDQPNIREIRMEDLIRSPYETMLDAFVFVGLAKVTPMLPATYLAGQLLNRINLKTRGLFPLRLESATLPSQELLGIVHANRFEAQADGRRPGEEDVRSHYRKGRAGDWVEHFTPEHRAYFKQHFNQVLLKLGYERTVDW